MRDGANPRGAGPSGARPRAIASPLARVLTAALTGLLVLAGPVAPLTLTASAATRELVGYPSADATQRLSVSLVSVTPAVATPGQPVTVAVRVRNDRPVAAAGVRVRVALGRSSLVGFDAVDAAVTDEMRASAREAGAVVLPGPLPAGSSSVVSVPIAQPVLPSRAYGVVALMVGATEVGAPLGARSGAQSGAQDDATQAGGVGAAAETTTTATVDSYLPFLRRKEFEPLRIGVLAPLTPDPDPAFLSADPQTQAGAWTAMTGARGRISRILSAVNSASAATPALPVTLAVDPVLVGGGGVGSEVAPGGGSSTTTSADSPTSPASASPASASPSAASTASSGTATGSPSPSQSPSPSPSPSGTTGADAVSAAAAARATIRGEQQRIAASLGPLRTAGTLWRLPVDDPDLSALAGTSETLGSGALSPDAARVLGRALRTGTESAVESSGGGTEAEGGSGKNTPANVLSGPIPEILWPVDGLPGAEARRDIAAALPATGRAAAMIAPLSALDGNTHAADASQSSARRTLTDGTAILASDEVLSESFAQATTGGGWNAAAVQHFLAQSLALLDQRPGVSRSVLVTMPRTWSPDGAAMTTLTRALGSAQWISPATATTLLGDSSSTAKAAGNPGTHDSASGASGATASSSATTSPSTVSSSTASPNGTESAADAATDTTVAASPLTPAVIRELDRQDATVRGVAAVLPPDNTTLTTPLLQRVASLASTRWRSRAATGKQGYATVRSAVSTEVQALGDGIRVQASDVNFFAESGVLQVTVVNALPVTVHDVELRMTVSDGGRLRITEQPRPLVIRANSRVIVKVPVEAIAAGLVPVSATLLTPDGTRLGSQTTVHVQVQPTNGWVVLAIGGLALVVFLAGLLRAVRRGRSRMSIADAAASARTAQQPERPAVADSPESQEKHTP